MDVYVYLFMGYISFLVSSLFLKEFFLGRRNTRCKKSTPITTCTPIVGDANLYQFFIHTILKNNKDLSVVLVCDPKLFSLVFEQQHIWETQEFKDALVHFSKQKKHTKISNMIQLLNGWSY